MNNFINGGFGLNSFQVNIGTTNDQNNNIYGQNVYGQVGNFSNGCYVPSQNVHNGLSNFNGYNQHTFSHGYGHGYGFSGYGPNGHGQKVMRELRTVLDLDKMS